MVKWSANGSALIKKHTTYIKDKFVEAYESTAIEEFGKMIEDSPIGIDINGTSTGVYRGNWQASRTVNSRVFKTPNKSKGAEYIDGKVRGKLSNGKPMFIFNNSPYGGVIEFGGYPDPVKLGTYIRGVGYVKRSSGGFSRQAPGGHVRKAVLRFRRRLPNNLRKALK